MKKIVLLLCVAALVLMSLAGCGESPKTPDTETTSSIVSSTDISTTKSQLTTEATTSTTKTTTTTTKKTTATTTQPSHIHKFNPATCTSPEICSCGATRDRAQGHQYSPATCTTPKICVRCGVIAAAALGHQFDSATCTSPKICSVCGEVTGSPLGHDYIEATCTSGKICNRCGTISGDALGHDFVNKKCTRCGKLDRTYLIEDIDYLRSFDYFYYDDDAITDNSGNVFSGHYHFFTHITNFDAYISFDLKGKYTTFNGTVLLPYENRGTPHTSCIKIYGDDKLLYQSPNITSGFETTDITVNVTGVKVLKIEFLPYTTLNGIESIPYLTNAYLEK